MKTIRYSLMMVVAAAAMVGFSQPTALAEEEAARKGKGKNLTEEQRQAKKEKREARRAERLAKYDKDGDGELSEDERKVAREARKAEVLKKFDKDGDGELNDDERKAAREARGKKCKKGGQGKGKGKERLNQTNNNTSA